MICTQTMRQNYRCYGDLLCFDLTYKLLKKRKTDSKHLGVGFFVGQDENTRIIIFGLCTITVESSENFKTAFSFFFDCMDNHIPETILTDEQHALVNGI